MKNKDGHVVTDRKDIADVFACFYEKLFTSKVHCTFEASSGGMPLFTLQELQATINQLKQSKCKDESNILAEMVQLGGDTLVQCLLDMYNENLSPQAIPPKHWRSTTIKVLLKGDDFKDPANYRTISIIPILYKIFAKLLYARLLRIFDPHQSAEQAGFHWGFSAVELMYTFSMLESKAAEWNQHLWIAAPDLLTPWSTMQFGLH